MKQKLLFLTLLSVTLIGFAKPKPKTTTNPAIGVMLSAFNTGGPIFFNITIKNTGEEILTNIYLTDASPIPGMQLSSISIPSLAPGEETSISAFKESGQSICFDQSQVMVHATSSSNVNIEILDLSSDPNGFDNNGLPGSYYNDIITNSSFFNYIGGSQDGTYVDLNNNNMVDVGDVVGYTYNVYANSSLTSGMIYDDNAIIVNPVFSNGSGSTTGIHYITQEEVNLGYVYNHSYIMTDGPCDYSGGISDNSPCSCPNPDNANIITPLTSALPNQIAGNIRFNSGNDNCATGVNFPNRRVSTTDGTYTYSTYTNANGDFHILIPNTGTYTTSALTNLSANFSSNPTATVTNSTSSGAIFYNGGFCISSATNYTDLEVNMFNINQAIPGNVATYRITYSNHGSTALSGSIQLTYDNGKLTLANATPTQNSSTAATLTWNYTNLLPFETRAINLSLNVLIPPTVNVNDLLAFTVMANPTAGDNNPADNTLTWNQTVRSSFDPNDKTVIQGATISPAQVPNYLTYVTRFQNTGTANATTVVIKETLDPKLDWSTFEPIASSHDASIQIKDGNSVTYTYSNIDLAYESSNEPASHGWMTYRIKPKANVVIGDIMSSKSDIYFDYNAPVITNTVNTQVTALGTTDFIKNNFKIYPNPASAYFVVEANTTTDARYEISDINGKVLQSDTVENLKPVDISNLQSGFYLVNIKTNQGKATYKLIKN
ncbi:DUF7619 domain-containing protein [Flavobacterium sp. XGLA_31]|uniref:DUF7619 domain-containing protein n=1 Tax=Flavobacterium sp. XGLA_31 TaxID=3447666 RepID=UPI003F359BAB